MPLPIGTILKITRPDCFRARDNGTKYWKITNNPSTSLYYKEYKSYPVIRCSKTGKEYKETNGFDCDYIDNRGQKSGEVEVICQAEVGPKANIGVGLEIGKRKRRIDYLRARIASDNLQLISLKAELQKLQGLNIQTEI